MSYTQPGIKQSLTTQDSRLKTQNSRLTTRFSFDLIRLPNRRYRFESELLRADAEIIVLRHEIQPSKPFVFGGEEVIGPGYGAVWFLFQGQPYDIGLFYRPDGTWTGFYIDILEPVRWDMKEVPVIDPLVDLALDIWIAPDGSYQVLDQDEYDVSVERGDLSPAQAAHACSALNALVASI